MIKLKNFLVTLNKNKKGERKNIEAFDLSKKRNMKSILWWLEIEGQYLIVGTEYRDI